MGREMEMGKEIKKDKERCGVMSMGEGKKIINDFLLGNKQRS